MNADYKNLTDLNQVYKYIKNSHIVSFDYETAPDKEYRQENKAALDPHKAHIVGCSFSVSPNTGIYVPIDHKTGQNADKEKFYRLLRNFLTDENIIKVAHNLSFESLMSYAIGIVIKPPVYDTMAAAQLTLKNSYEFRSLSSCGLKKLATEICSEPLPSFDTVTGGRFFDELDPDDRETTRYACADSDFSLRLYHIFNSWFDRFIPKHRKIIEDIESPTSVYLGIMKYNGIPIDYPLMLERKAHAESERNRIKEKIGFIIGDISIGENCSTKAFKDYLFKTLKLPVLKTTLSNKEAIDDITLIMLKEWCQSNKPELSELFTLVQEYRKWGKIKSTYIDGYIKHINSVTKNIHPNIFSLSTDTGRMNCQNPNAQNMPRKSNDPIGVRNFIKAPENCLILSLDFSQIELRVGAFYCKDEVMNRIYRHGGDIHAATTSVIFGCSYEEAQNKHNPLYKERRTIAKNVNFGTFYGLYPKGLQRTLKFKAGIEKTEQECRDIIENLKSGYRGLSIWQANTTAEAYRTAYSETYLGRRRYLPGIRSGDFSVKSFAQRCALNTPIQGTAADILKLAVGRILKGLGERPWLKPILQIHDELTFIIPEDKLREAVKFIKGCMEAKPFEEFDLPLIAEASAGKTFGNMEDLEDI